MPKIGCFIDSGQSKLTIWMLIGQNKNNERQMNCQNNVPRVKPQEQPPQKSHNSIDKAKQKASSPYALNNLKIDSIRIAQYSWINCKNRFHLHCVVSQYLNNHFLSNIKHQILAANSICRQKEKEQMTISPLRFEHSISCCTRTRPMKVVSSTDHVIIAINQLELII